MEAIQTFVPGETGKMLAVSEKKHDCLYHSEGSVWD